MLRKLISKSRFPRFALLYAANFHDRFQRAALAATDGPDFYKRRLWKRYLTPDPDFVPVSLGAEFDAHLATLRRDGIVRIEGAVFDQAAASLRDLVTRLRLDGFRRPDRVTDFEIDLGFALPEVLQMMSHPDLCGMYCNYYGRQAYYREHPLLVGSSSGNPGVDRSSSHVHCDGFRQLTFQFLVKDVSEQDTHLIFYKGSHREPKLDYRRVTENEQLIHEYQPILGAGRAGTLWVFESGSGFHSGKYLAGQRVMLTGVITSGWLPFKDRLRADEDAFSVLGKDSPRHVRDMFIRR
jgi:hypothetical protein